MEWGSYHAQMTEDNGKPSVPAWEINLIAYVTEIVSAVLTKIQTLTGSSRPPGAYHGLPTKPQRQAWQTFNDNNKVHNISKSHKARSI